MNSIELTEKQLKEINDILEKTRQGFYDDWGNVYGENPQALEAIRGVVEAKE